MHGFMTTRALQTGSRYKLKPIEPIYQRLAEAALRRAWERLKTDTEFAGLDLLTSPEVTINERLAPALEMVRAARDVPGFSKHFETPQTDGGLRSFDGQKLSKRPDLSLRLKVNPDPGINSFYRRIYVEAKLIDPGTRTWKAYWSQGVHRYVCGDYAWGMSHAMMLAYARCPKRRLPDALDALLDDDALRASVQLQSAKAMLWSGTAGPGGSYATNHARQWTHQDGSAPGPIEVVHLWVTPA